MSEIMAQVEYQGNLRTKAQHKRSGETIITDAPVDNQGKGEAFSPTDLVSSALCSCMMTIMGQVAQRENITLEGLKADVTKVMASNPRRIAEIHVTFSHPSLQITEVQRQKLKNAAHTCPVAVSLAESIVQKVEFNF